MYKRETNLKLYESHRVSVIGPLIGKLGKSLHSLFATAQTVTIEVPQEAISEVTFPITINWRPDYKVSGTRKAEYTITNGRLQGNLAEFEDKASQTIVVTRDLDKTFFFSITIDGKPGDIVTLPPVPSQGSCL